MVPSVLVTKQPYNTKYYNYTCTCIYTCTCTLYIRAGKNLRMFKPSFICCTFEYKFSLRSFTATPTLMFAHAHSNVWLIMWVCSSKGEDVLLAASVSFLSPAMLNSSRNRDRNKTRTGYKAITSFG